jgi:hypothetical protein
VTKAADLMSHSKCTSNNQPLASLHTDAGFSDVPGEETSPFQEEEETHLPCTARAHATTMPTTSKDSQEDFNDTFQAPPEEN